LLRGSSEQHAGKNPNSRGEGGITKDFSRGLLRGVVTKGYGDVGRGSSKVKRGRPSKLAARSLKRPQAGMKEGRRAGSTKTPWRGAAKKKFDKGAKGGKKTKGGGERYVEG